MVIYLQSRALESSKDSKLQSNKTTYQTRPRASLCFCLFSFWWWTTNLYWQQIHETTRLGTATNNPVTDAVRRNESVPVLLFCWFDSQTFKTPTILSQKQYFIRFYVPTAFWFLLPLKLQVSDVTSFILEIDWSSSLSFSSSSAQLPFRDSFLTIFAFNLTANGSTERNYTQRREDQHTLPWGFVICDSAHNSVCSSTQCSEIQRPNMY